MHDISAVEAAADWGITQHRVADFRLDGHVKNASLLDSMRLVPGRSQNPNGVTDPSCQPGTLSVVKPFLKWAGGKAQALESIRLKYPAGLGKEITKYAEPFVGGGAVLFDILSNYAMEQIYISDINHALISTYKAVKENIEDLIPALKRYRDKYLLATESVRKDIFYINRARFNELNLAKSDSVELAALFIFLNHTCFNGLYRVNSRGEFNVPQGSYKNPSIFEEATLKEISEKLQNVTIVCGDYRQSWDFIDACTFAYFDPPYRPLTATASFTAYAQDGFDDKQQIQLAQFVDSLCEKGAYVLASNSDPKNTNEADEFFDELYSRHKIFRIGISRSINSNGKSRGKINELLIQAAKERIKMRDFNEWMSHFKKSMYTYAHYVDFDKVFRNVDAIKVELNILNSLIGSNDIENDFERIIRKYPETLKCIPILLAVRNRKIHAQDNEGEFTYNFGRINYDIDQYKTFMRKTGLFDLMQTHIISNLVDYVTGVETGLDSNGRKNRGGHLMENLVELYLQSSGFVKGETYFKEMRLANIESKWNLSLSSISNQGKTVKRFDFVVKTPSTVYAIETNFFGGGGSKLNETARSYKNIALEARAIDGFAFVWFTDGGGWASARHNLEETFDVLDNMYNINDLENGVMQRIFV